MAMKEAPVASLRISSAQADFDALRYVGPEAPCPYLPGQVSRNEAFRVEQLAPAHYEMMMARGFRRSGRIVYRPRCQGCSECRSIRVPLEQFQYTRSLRRVWRKNQDLSVEVTSPEPTEEKYELFRRYLDERHDDTMPRSTEAFEGFLYDTPTHTLEFSYRLGERLVGVGIADRCPGGLSSVYMYSEPAFPSRSLGTFSVLWEIEWCRRQGLAYYYLGYYVAGSVTMAYKARFRPNELLKDGQWVAFGQ